MDNPEGTKVRTRTHSTNERDRFSLPMLTTSKTQCEPQVRSSPKTQQYHLPALYIISR